ncbi:YniB family protein [Erwinia sp. DT-104]|uniref:YniB family protein n=1 Tax=Erwinia sp. DT-104 TaxID=3396161 RepID=UPI003F1DAFC6
MDYNQARKTVRQKKMIGAVIILVFGLLTIFGFIKFIYIQAIQGSNGGIDLLHPVKYLIAELYYLPYFPRFIWPISPAPDFENSLFSKGNLYFYFVYAMTFVGMAVYASGSELNKEIKEILSEIRKEDIKRTARGESPRPDIREDRSLPVKNESFFSQVNELYIAPIVVAIILWFLGIG